MSDRFTLSSAVQKELKARNLTADGVIREALKIKIEGFTSTDGKFFPEGTAFIAWYKDKACSAIVKNGAIEIDGKAYTSVSAAAAHYTGRATRNGWDFWYVRTPGSDTFILASKAATQVKAA